MVTIIVNKVEDGVPPPNGNGFSLCVHEVDELGGGYYRVDTGVSVSIPEGFNLRVDSTEQWIVLGWTIRKGRLVIVVASAIGKRPIKKEMVASAWIYKDCLETVRFRQRGESGGRIIRGDAKVVDCIESRDSEPGE